MSVRRFIPPAVLAVVVTGIVTGYGGPTVAEARPCLSKSLAKAEAREAVDEGYGRPGRIFKPVRSSCQRWQFLYEVGEELGAVVIIQLSYGQFHYRLSPVSGKLP